jgi:DNA replicative helicase MCM subunit Mcm2 (Cdc46/Mcm family)
MWEMEDVKKRILLQFFGATNKVFLKGGGPKYRRDINILLCGDPSTSKSHMLKVTNLEVLISQGLVCAQNCSTWSIYEWQG